LTCEAVQSQFTAVNENHIISFNYRSQPDSLARELATRGNYRTFITVFKNTVLASATVFTGSLGKLL